MTTRRMTNVRESIVDCQHVHGYMVNYYYTKRGGTVGRKAIPVEVIAENFLTPDNPLLQAGRRPLVNVAKNARLRPVA